MAAFTKPSYYTIRGDSTLLNKCFRFLFSLLSISILIPTVAWADDGDMTTVVGTGPTGLFAGGFSGDAGDPHPLRLSGPGVAAAAIPGLRRPASAGGYNQLLSPIPTT